MAEGDDGDRRMVRRALAQRTKEVRRLNQQRAALEAAIKSLEAEREKLSRERDEGIAQARKQYDETPLRTELERLQGEIRHRDHRAVWEAEAVELGADRDSVDLLMSHAGYKAEGDAPDPAAIRAKLEEQKGQGATSRLFQAAGPAPAPAPGSGRGGRDQTPAVWRVPAEKLKDGAWSMANAAALQKARQEGRLEIV